MKLFVRHTTTYIYEQEVGFSPHKVVLRPREDHHTRVYDFRLDISPPCKITWSRDTQENAIAQCFFNEKSNVLRIHAEMVVELLQNNPFDFILEDYASKYPFIYSQTDYIALSHYLNLVPNSHNVSAWLKNVINPSNEDTLIVLNKLNSTIFSSITYLKRDEEGIQSPNTTLEILRGSCRDTAWLFVAACRYLGIAARFVSGYLYVPEPLMAQNLPGFRNDHSIHAWAEVYLPGAGWKGFDPSSGVLAGDHYISVAVSSFPETISPIQGKYIHTNSVTSTLNVDVVIDRIP